LLAEAGAAFTLARSQQTSEVSKTSEVWRAGPGAASRTFDVLALRLDGASATAQAVGSQELTSRSNYFTGTSPENWHTDVANSGQVQVHDGCPGMGLAYYGSAQAQLEFDFTVAPGADPSQVRMEFAGARGITQDGQGGLHLQTGGGEVLALAPTLYQARGAGRLPVR